MDNIKETIERIADLSSQIGVKEFIIEVQLHEGMDESKEEIQAEIDEMKVYMQELVDSITGNQKGAAL